LQYRNRRIKDRERNVQADGGFESRPAVRRNKFTEHVARRGKS
jgi:hypothetical protein